MKTIVYLIAVIMFLLFIVWTVTCKWGLCLIVVVINFVIDTVQRLFDGFEIWCWDWMNEYNSGHGPRPQRETAVPCAKCYYNGDCLDVAACISCNYGNFNPAH